MDAQSGEHLARKQWETGTKGTSHDCVTGETTGGLGKVDVDDAVEDAEEDEENGESKERAGHHGRPETDRPVRGPAQPEEGDDEAGCGDADNLQPLLRWHSSLALTRVLFDLGDVARVHDDDVEDDTDDTTQEERDKGETLLQCVKAMDLLKDEGICAKEQVDDAVDE